MKYNVDYFIKKFEAIPKNKWCTDVFYDYESRYCAAGHCGQTRFKVTDESRALSKIFGHFAVSDINDGITTSFKGKHPRTRILNALKQIKKGVK